MTTKRVEKGWGYELVIANNENYCGKLLVFNKGKKFSMHFHKDKHETWYVNKGSFILRLVDLQTGLVSEKTIKEGDIVPIKQFLPHQLEALEDAVIFEVSTQHFDHDSYRLWKGD